MPRALVMLPASARSCPSWTAPTALVPPRATAITIAALIVTISKSVGFPTGLLQALAGDQIVTDNPPTMSLVSIVQLLLLATADAARGSSAAAWPHSVQPFFLSALSSNLTSADVQYLAGLPVVVINHKEGGTGSPEEERQLHALSQVKAANASCATFFYLNSQIDFPGLQLHQEFVANGVRAPPSISDAILARASRPRYRRRGAWAYSFARLRCTRSHADVVAARRQGQLRAP